MNSSVSALTASDAGGASSSSDSGGSGESGMSVNSGRCFSLTTRSDSRHGRDRRHDDDRLAELLLLARALDQLVALELRLLADPAVLALLPLRAHPGDHRVDARADALHHPAATTGR